MINIPGYSITRTVYEDSYLLVAFASIEQTSKQVLLKIVKSGRSVTIENAKLIHEFNFLSELDMKGLLKPSSYLNFKNMMVLEYEPVHALTLRDYWSKATVTPDTYVQIMKSVVTRLQELHEHQILHLNIRPDTLLIQRHTDEVFLTGFGYAVQMNERKEQGQSSLEGNPIYMSPEQTGRMDYPVDDRADIYSLGMAFYELFARRLPFTAKGALDWAHAHLALQPVPLDQANPTIPSIISDIVMKMLAKNPESRYPSMKAILEQLGEHTLVVNGKNSFARAKWEMSANGGDDPRNTGLPWHTNATAFSSGDHHVQAHRTTLVVTDNIVSYPQVLDLAAIVQASEIFAENMSGEQIAEQLMQLIIKNAGAQRGLLIIPSHNQWYVSIEAKLEGQAKVSSLQHIPLDTYPEIRRELVAGALQEKMVMQAATREAFRETALAARSKVSGIILCMPIVIHEEVHGLLYMENMLTSKHFAAERFHVIKNLASQALFALKSRLLAISTGDRHDEEQVIELDGLTEVRRSLTTREQEVLKLVSEGLSNKEIAAALTVTSETVKTHLKNIFEKLKVDRRMKAAAIAKTIGLLDEEERR
ncbi:hypothetical protein YSY43_36350 [Paenibacillus sp. YSY-4.3]